MAGRATLIQSAIASIPTYVMQTVKLPRTLYDEIDRKSRRFLWGGSEQTERIHNVSWGQIIQAKQVGGQLAFEVPEKPMQRFSPNSNGCY